MTKIKTEHFVMERRTFLQLSAAAAIAGGIINIDEAAAQGMCMPVDQAGIPNINPASFGDPSNNLVYWIDGLMNTTNALTGYANALPVRARLSCTMVRPHTATNYVQSVSLVETSGGVRNLLGSYFYGPDVGTITGRVPYTVFENLELDPLKSYEVIYVVNQMGAISYFRHTITSPRPSRFDYSHLANPAQFQELLPFSMVAEIKATNLYHFSATPAQTGYVTTPYGTSIDHQCNARVRKIEPRGSGGENEGKFEIEVDFMHGDISDAHYMRYFLVCDPVGRILGGIRRNYQDGVSGSVLVKRGFHTPISNNTNTSGVSNGIQMIYTDKNNKQYGRLHGTIATDNVGGTATIPALNGDQINLYINSLNILDCPHISIYTDDRFHAIARYTLRLR